MNQGERLVRRKCAECGRIIRVKQVYNTHTSDWEDIEPWICDKCMERSEEYGEEELAKRWNRRADNETD